MRNFGEHDTLNAFSIYIRIALVFAPASPSNEIEFRQETRIMTAPSLIRDAEMLNLLRVAFTWWAF